MQMPNKNCFQSYKETVCMVSTLCVSVLIETGHRRAREKGKERQSKSDLVPVRFFLLEFQLLN